MNTWNLRTIIIRSACTRVLTLVVADILHGNADEKKKLNKTLLKQLRQNRSERIIGRRSGVRGSVENLHKY